MIEILAIAANTYGLGYYDFEKGFLINKAVHNEIVVLKVRRETYEDYNQ